jgi:PhnB protein
MKTCTYLNFDGQCETAFQFYEKCLGGKILFKMTYGDSPMADQMPAALKNAIMHMRMSVGDSVILGSDAPPERFQKPQGFNVTLNIESAEEAERVFAELSEGGAVGMPIQETFWALRFGMLVDRFGIPWMINCEKTPD